MGESIIFVLASVGVVDCPKSIPLWISLQAKKYSNASKNIVWKTSLTEVPESASSIRHPSQSKLHVNNLFVSSTNLGDFVGSMIGVGGS